MNKTELILRIAEETRLLPEECGARPERRHQPDHQALTEEEKVQIVGFGAFETKVRAERMGRNPKTGETSPSPPPRCRL